MYIVLLQLLNYIKNTTCISLSNWLQYSFSNPFELYTGFCIIDHRSKNVLLALDCRELKLFEECYQSH
jgi:hypothetical protein